MHDWAHPEVRQQAFAGFELPLRGSEAAGRKRLTLVVLSACTKSVTSGYMRAAPIQ